MLENVPDDAVFEINASDSNSRGEKILVSGDKEKHIDGLIFNAKRYLTSNNSDNYAIFHQAALQSILADIKDDLADFGVRFDKWFSEKSLDNSIHSALDLLEQKGFLYQQDGNTWFKSTEFGDEKDRVVKRANGQFTYFASDIAYVYFYLDRLFDFFF